MKHILLITRFLIVCNISLGQTTKWQVSIQLQPEITFHKDSYSWWKENADRSTSNMGIASLVYYNINERFFLNSGVGFISRTLQTSNFLDQSALPPPRRSLSMELVTTESVAYGVLSIPINVVTTLFQPIN
jgi:hypothetical protein